MTSKHTSGNRRADVEEGVYKTSVDKPMFLATIFAILLVVIPVMLWQQHAADLMRQAHAAITTHLGVFYQWYGIAVVGFLVYIATGRFGSVRLGGREAQPEFSTLSWVGMLFTAGVGAGLLYWAFIEWGYYIDAPPFGVEPRSASAIEWAGSYGLFHWGITGWAFFCLPALAISYAYYNRNIPYLRLSTGCSSYLPNGVNSKRGRVIDFLYMINLIGGTGTSLGLSTPMIAACCAKLFGWQHDFALEVAVVVLCILIFGGSAYLGLKKGIKRLADINVFLALTLLFFVFAVGPTLFILKMGTNGIGLILQNFIRMNTWTDPVKNSGFVELWTVFYWAWWMAYAPYVGIFVARISRGRTLRNVIVGMLLLGSLGAALFFIVFGNYALHLELNNVLNVTQVMKESGEATAIAQVLGSLPFPTLALAVFLIVAFIFVATTYDSASYTLASVSTKHLQAGDDPSRWNRVFWACALGVLPIMLMFLDKDLAEGTAAALRVVLSITIVVSLPLLAVGVLLAMSLMRMLREDTAKSIPN